MAGTVVNEDNVVYKTLRLALNKGGIPVTLDQVLLHGAGKEKSQAIRDIAAEYAPVGNVTGVELMYNDFLTLLNKAYENLEVAPVNGAEALFNELRSRKIYRVLNTGYNSKTANQLLTKLRWTKGKEYDELITASDVSKTRPYPDMILLGMQRVGVSDSGGVMKVGDSAIDIEEGKNAHCGSTVGITTGAHTRQQLEAAQPDYIIDELSEIARILTTRH